MDEEFTCEVERPWGADYRSACKGLDCYGEHEEKRYCVLHYPGEEKNEDFEEVKKSKLAQKDFEFGGAVFPKGTSDFKGREFDADANFAGAIFNGTADFSNARFNSKTSFIETRFTGERTDFKKAQFTGEETDFRGAQFTGKWTFFNYAQFNGKWTHFSNARFNSEQTSFLRAQFTGERTDFRGAQFTGERTFFNYAQFNGERTHFSEALFSSSERTYFREAKFTGKQKDFKKAQFTGEETDFREAQFTGEETDFREAQFTGERTDFRGAQFTGEETSFSGAEFGSVQTRFQKATFKGVVRFSEATFKEKVTFWGTKEEPENLVFGSQAWVWFHDSLIEEPELLTFNTALLHPGWFINTDVRKVNFTDVQWYGMPDGIPEGTLDEEIQALKQRGRESPYTLLAQACRRLSTNAEENHEYPLANEFHYWSMDALRKGRWSRFKSLSLRGLTKKETWRAIREHFGVITTLYWALSGYGVRAGRALGVLVVVWAGFAILYMLLGPGELRMFSPEVWWLPSILAGFPAFVPSELNLLTVRSVVEGMTHIGQAMVYSLSTLARLNPEPKPDPGLFQFLVTVEGIVGPLQIALLALAIRRKVMR